MVAGPEVARVIVEFEDFNMHPRNQEETRHHEETPSVQNTFARDVRSLVAVTRGRHENQQCPPALSDGGRLYLGSKSDLLVCLECHAEPQSEVPTVTAVVLDGAVIVQMLKPGTAKMFEEYAQQVFIPYVVRQLQHVSRLDLVWDSYRADSLKASTREQRGKGVRRRVVDS